MPALTTLAIVGAGVLSAGATYAQVKETKRNNAAQEQRLKEQEQEAKDTAREQSALEDAAEDTGAEIQLGREDTSTADGTGPGTGASSTRDGFTQARVGALGGKDARKKRVSTGLGL